MELVEEMGTDLRSIVVFLVAIFDISMSGERMGSNLLFGTVAKLNNASHHLFQQDSKEDLELSEKLHVT